MKKNFIVAQSRKRPNGYFDCFTEKFSTKEEAQKYVEKLEKQYLAGKNTNDFEIDGDQGVLTIEAIDKSQKFIVELIAVESNANTLFVLFKNDTNEEEFERHVFTNIEDAKNYIKETAEEYKDLFCAEIRDASYDGNVKAIDGGDYGHGYIDGKYNLSDVTLHFEIRKPSQKNVVDIMVEEVQF